MQKPTNLELVTRGFNLLLKKLAPYILNELRDVYGNDLWKKGVLDKLHDDQKRNLPLSGTPEELLGSLDIACCLLLMDVQWREIFRRKLPQDCKNYVMELKGTRNKWAHAGAAGISASDTWRALDTMSRLAEHIDPDTAEQINKLMRLARYGNTEGSTAQATNVAPTQEPRKAALDETKAAAGLPSWREIMEPHMDVAEGRYKNAEFAADLSQVAQGKGELEYRDPVEFFNRTYITEGMKGLLVQSLRRVAGLDGEPVIQLKTAFGGGKTHSMLALYHMMRNRSRVSDIDALKPIFKEAGVESIPDIRVAVIVGTALNPAKSTRPATMPGITVNTLWGEIAFQLAEAARNPSIYEYVRDADRKGVSPGSKALTEMFDACGCCLVLMDELVAYARKLYGKDQDKLPAGTFENFITFVQELTEAARASKCSLVVASIPESDNEIGGEAGQKALEQIEHTFGRMEAIWKPVAASEGFEVVRRRLFLDCKNPDAREEVCDAFSRFYRDNASDFPVDSRELEYRARMISCYPIHPEVFDRLYEDWATLERFQRTRGVLRLMAAVIHELWMHQDPAPMIMPGSFPLDVPSVRDELTRYLDDNWNGVVDSEIDGKHSVPYRNDSENRRYGGCLASRRVARAVMLGSAPDVSGQKTRGIERAHIRLGTVQPGENISIFNDALNTLQSRSSFLYSDTTGNRFWYDTRPTLRKAAEDRAQQVEDSSAYDEIEARLKKQQIAAPFSGKHICPATSLDVPDEDSLRIVILRPAVSHQGRDDNSMAIQTAHDFLENRGTAPRNYKNMVVFAAADKSYVGKLIEEAKKFLAWTSISNDRERLNLDVSQTREVNQAIKLADQSLNAKIEEAYCWLLTPRIDLAPGSTDIEWDVDHVSGSGEGIIAKMGKNLLSNETAITHWAPTLLRMELDRLLWRDQDHIQIKQLWNFLCSYCYLPRLAGYHVLEETIQNGSNSSEFFGIAADYSDNRYIDLTLNENRSYITPNDLLVKPNIAQERIALERETKRFADARVPSPVSADVPGITVPGSSTPDNDSPSTDNNVALPDNPVTPVKPAQPTVTSFVMETELDYTRVNHKMQLLLDEVIRQIANLDGAEIELTLTVKARVKEGIPIPTIRAVSENCSVLGIHNFQFD